jgi:hypothetical protein
MWAGEQSPAHFYIRISIMRKNNKLYRTLDSMFRDALNTLFEEIESMNTVDSNRQMQDQMRKQKEMLKKQEEERRKRVEPQLRKLQSTMSDVNTNVQKGMSAALQTNTTFDELGDDMEDIETMLQGLEKEF